MIVTATVLGVGPMLFTAATLREVICMALVAGHFVDVGVEGIERA